MLKFNMGCGHNRIAGHVNVDAMALCEPDEVWDLEVTPWPWPDSCAERIVFNHSLEHMGGDPKIFLEIMKEIYRISAHDCELIIHVPHPRHDDFLGDPTHVRAITPSLMNLFNRRLNDEWRAMKAANSPLAYYTGVDFENFHTEVRATPKYQAMLDAKRLSSSEFLEIADERLNVIREYRLRYRARKPPYGQQALVTNERDNDQSIPAARGSAGVSGSA